MANDPRVPFSEICKLLWNFNLLKIVSTTIKSMCSKILICSLHSIYNIRSMRSIVVVAGPATASHTTAPALGPRILGFDTTREAVRSAWLQAGKANGRLLADTLPDAGTGLARV